MLESIIDFINLKLGLLNYFEKTHCLSTLVKNDDGLIYPAEYISNGDFDAVDFDAYDGVSYIRVNGEIDVERVDQRYTPKPRLNVTFPLRLVYAVRKDKLTKDDAYSFDRVRGSLVKQLESDSADLANQLEADKIVVSTSNYISDTKELWDEETAETGTFQPKYEVVFGSMEVSVTVTTRAECIPSECDDFESDILRTFDFCKTNTQDRLTSTQVDCLTDWLCDGTSSPVTIQINGVTYTTAPAGTTYNQEFVNTDGDAVGTAANPSVVGDSTIQINGVSAGSVVAEGTYNQGFENSQGNTVGTAANPSIAGDATVTINGDSLGSEGSIPSEESNDITVNLDGSPSGSWNGTSWEVTSAACDDATVNANGVLVSNVASGGTLNIDVHDTDNNDVGTVTGTEIEIADTTITINSSSLGATGSVLAEGSLDIPVNLDGSPAGSWDGDSWEVTSAPCVTPSVSVVISDTTPDFNDAVTITATPTGITPTNYRFHIPDSRGKYNVIEQASNVYNWTVGFTGTYDVYVEAEEATDGVCEVGGVSVTSSSGGVLNQYTGARVGFSCQSISSYSDFPIMTIRRSSDNAQNSFYPNLSNKIGLDSKDAEGVTLSSWIGSDSGYIVRWFHQGSELYYAFQDVAASQPRIVNAGTLEVVNGEPAIFFDGVDDFLKTNTGNISQPLTYFIVAKRDSSSLPTDTLTLISGSVLSGRVQVFQTASSMDIFAGGTPVSSGATTTDQQLHTTLFDNANSEYWKDGSSVATGNPGSNTIQDDLEIGAQRGGVNSWYGHIQEILVYPSDQSANRVAIETNINNRYSIY